MKTLIKTLTVLTAGVGAVAVVKRVSEKLETKSYSRENHRESIRIVTNGKQATLSVQTPYEFRTHVLLVD